MIREHLNPPNQNNKQILEKINKKIGQSEHFSVFAKLVSAKSWPSISPLNGHFTQPPGRLILLPFLQCLFQQTPAPYFTRENCYIFVLQKQSLAYPKQVFYPVVFIILQMHARSSLHINPCSTTKMKFSAFLLKFIMR